MQIKLAIDGYTDGVIMNEAQAEPGRRGARAGRLSDMVLAANVAGMSYAQMAARSIGPNGEKGMSKPWFARLATGGVMSAPTPEELEAVARAVGRPLRIIKEAAAHQFLEWESYELSGYDDDMRHIIIHAAGMDPQGRRRLRAMLDAADQVDRDAASG
jgi:hypothetical protein